MTKAQIRNEFNDQSEKLGCRARIGGNGKTEKFFEFRGTFTKGQEIWFGIDIHRFIILTNPYPELHN